MLQAALLVEGAQSDGTVLHVTENVLPDIWTGDAVKLVAEVRTRDVGTLTYAFLGARLLPDDDAALWAWDDGNRWHYEVVEPVQKGANWSWDTLEASITVRTPTIEELPALVPDPQAWSPPSST